MADKPEEGNFRNLLTAIEIPSLEGYAKRGVGFPDRGLIQNLSEKGFGYRKSSLPYSYTYSYTQISHSSCPKREKEIRVYEYVYEYGGKDSRNAACSERQPLFG